MKTAYLTDSSGTAIPCRCCFSAKPPNRATHYAHGSESDPSCDQCDPSAFAIHNCRECAGSGWRLADLKLCACVDFQRVAVAS